MLEMLSLRLRFCSIGLGDSVRRGVSRSRRLFAAEGRGDWHSSQVRRAASFSNVQRGQATLDGMLDVGSGDAGVPFVCLCDICVNAAFATCDTDGLTPHARHAGMFVCLFAVAGSKLSGIGFEKPSMGHIHVAFELSAGAGVTDLMGLPCGAGDAAFGDCVDVCSGRGEFVIGLE